VLIVILAGCVLVSAYLQYKTAQLRQTNDVPPKRSVLSTAQHRVLVSNTVLEKKNPLPYLYVEGYTPDYRHLEDELFLVFTFIVFNACTSKVVAGDDPLKGFAFREGKRFQRDLHLLDSFTEIHPGNRVRIRLQQDVSESDRDAIWRAREKIGDWNQGTDPSFSFNEVKFKVIVDDVDYWLKLPSFIPMGATPLKRYRLRSGVGVHVGHDRKPCKPGAIVRLSHSEASAFGDKFEAVD
jgi:hypothetical protein